MKKHGLIVTITAQALDKNGKPVGKGTTIRAKSYVAVMAEWLHLQMCQNDITIKDVAGVAQGVDQHAGNFNIVGPDANANYGIVVGTGTTAVALTNYALATKIAGGTGAGQLTHYVTTFTTPVTSGTTRKFTILRTFLNQSSSQGTITIQEVGLYSIYTPGPNWYFCLERALTGGAGDWVVTYGHGVAVTYTIGITV